MPQHVRARHRSTWLFDRSLDPTVEFLEEYFGDAEEASRRSPRSQRVGPARRVTTSATRRSSSPCATRSRQRRTTTGTLPADQRQRGGGASVFVTAARKARTSACFYASYPITPASEIIHGLSRGSSTSTCQAPSRRRTSSPPSAPRSAAAFAGDLALTGTSGPGPRAQVRGAGPRRLRTSCRMVVIDVQRAGPATGLPTKTEQADLLQAMYGRTGEAPVRDRRRRAAPATASTWPIEAVRLAIRVHVPGHPTSRTATSRTARSRGASPTPTIPPIEIHAPGRANNGPRRLPALRPRPRDARAPVGAPRHARARAPHRRSREAGRDRQRFATTPTTTTTW